jgi:hypothetical protein
MATKRQPAKPAAPKPAATPAEPASQTAPASEASPEPERQRTGRELYVAVDSLSWRPHPLPRGTEVQDLLPSDVLEHCLERGTVSREHPDG